MVVTAVSAPAEKIAELKEKLISPSKAFQLGLDLALSGNINAVAEIKQLKGIVDQKEIQILKLEKKIGDLREEIAFLRETYVKTPEAPKSEQDNPPAEK